VSSQCEIMRGFNVYLSMYFSKENSLDKIKEHEQYTQTANK